MDVYIFGAGASAAEGAPAIGDFFARAWELLAPDFDPRVAAVWRFLEAVFRARVAGREAFACIPAVDEVISLVDWCLHVNSGLGPEYDPPRLYQVRRDLEHLLAVTLDVALAQRSRVTEGAHARFVRLLLDRRGPADVALLSLNYDTLLDDALRAAGAGPDYGLERAQARPNEAQGGRNEAQGGRNEAQGGRNEAQGGRNEAQGGLFLAKLHGSLNWWLCPACSYINLGDGRRPCSRCQSERLHSLIISPTWLKNYAGFRLQHIWDQALQRLGQADRILFVGYSMPPSDVAVYQLIRRALLTGGGRAPRISVINHRRPEQGATSPLVERFTRLFGAGVEFDFSGFHGQT